MRYLLWKLIYRKQAIIYEQQIIMMKNEIENLKKRLQYSNDEIIKLTMKMEKNNENWNLQY